MLSRDPVGSVPELKWRRQVVERSSVWIEKSYDSFLFSCALPFDTQRMKCCGELGDEGMNKRSHEVSQIKLEGGRFVVQGHEGQRLFVGTYTEVELWLDQRENRHQSRRVGQRRGILLQSILKAVRRT